MIKIKGKNSELRDGNFFVQVRFQTDIEIVDRPSGSATFTLDHDPSWDECMKLVIESLIGDLQEEIKLHESQIKKLKETLNQLKSEK